MPEPPDVRNKDSSGSPFTPFSLFEARFDHIAAHPGVRRLLRLMRGAYGYATPGCTTSADESCRRQSERRA
jgi:hypothetical protein